jgi:terminase small subunit / prophage DNA-packing protein
MEISATALQKLIGVRKSVLAELVEKGVVVKGKKRGIYTFESVTGYCAHLREIAAGRGGEDAVAAHARLGSAQGTLAETRRSNWRASLSHRLLGGQTF